MNALLAPDLVRRLRHYAADHDVDLTTALARAIEAFLAAPQPPASPSEPHAPDPL